MSEIISKNSCDCNGTNSSSGYIFHESASHGWLEVPLEELDRLGIRQDITAYSYYLNGKAYLEEDQDMSTFIHAKEACGDWTGIWTKYIMTDYKENWSPYGHNFPAMTEERMDKVRKRNYTAYMVRYA